MVPILGNLTLWLSLFFAILQFAISNKKNNLTEKFNKIFVVGLLIFTLTSFFSLMYCYIISDFTVLNVFQNSHTTKPLLYKISGVWGNHEGSMLLWILVLAIFNFFIFNFYNKTNFHFISKTLETQALIIIGFLIFTILTSNPFEKNISSQPDGLGFNPILQDPALAIHPPLLYLGYVGFSAAFSFSVAVLSLENNIKIPWYKYMRPFVITAWSFLSIGIALGAIWAYYELGWGGWWFWDPVENASFMPWLVGTALLHSLIAVEKKGSLKSWVLFLAILAFLLSVIGTFLVRSGILTSVHTFALDPSRGMYILSFTALLGGYSLILYKFKSKKFINNYHFDFFSKETTILINNVILLTVCASVFLGTIYPLLVEAFSNNKISVGEPYYNSIVIPIMIPGILIMGIGPILSWNTEDKLKILTKILPSILLTIIITIVFLLIYQSYNFLGIIGSLLAFWIISSNLVILLQKIGGIYNKKNFIKYSIPDCSFGMIVAHFGIALLILGITGSSVWQKEKIVRMKLNNEIKIQKYNVEFKQINEITGPNYVAIRGSFLVKDENKNLVATLRPENRFYPITNNYTTEASINTNLVRDLYIALGDGNINDGWVVRVYYNPLVMWIWIGSFLIFIGGIISVTNNLKKIKSLFT